jgi:hypothetical protein
MLLTSMILLMMLLKTPRGNANNWNNEIAGKIFSAVSGVLLVIAKVLNVAKATRNGVDDQKKNEKALKIPIFLSILSSRLFRTGVTGLKHVSALHTDHLGSLTIEYFLAESLFPAVQLEWTVMKSVMTSPRGITQPYLDRPNVGQDLVHQPSSSILVLHLLLLQGLEVLGNDGIDGQLRTNIVNPRTA